MEINEMANRKMNLYINNRERERERERERARENES